MPRTKLNRNLLRGRVWRNRQCFGRVLECELDIWMLPKKPNWYEFRAPPRPHTSCEQISSVAAEYLNLLLVGYLVNCWPSIFSQRFFRANHFVRIDHAAKDTGESKASAGKSQIKSKAPLLLMCWCRRGNSWISGGRLNQNGANSPIVCDLVTRLDPFLSKEILGDHSSCHQALWSTGPPRSSLGPQVVWW